MRQVAVHDAASFRRQARALAQADVPPADVLWYDAADAPPLLGAATPAASSSRALAVPRRFLQLVNSVVCHRDDERWAASYRVLYRLTHGEPHLLSLPSDPDARRLERMAQAVRHEVHKAKAFVRFRHLPAADAYVAWYVPAHPILPLVQDFFAERFVTMRWSILTPDGCIHWDGAALRQSPGLPRPPAQDDDALESLWLTYYGAIFNPARVNIRAMQQHMPQRFWARMPETAIIGALVRSAAPRVDVMRRGDVSAATAFLPPLGDGRGAPALAALREAVGACRACELCARATQPVFGQGPADAPLVLVGEQPGDEEDRRNRPFVGPAGRLLDELLAEAELDRSRIYVTNAVKAFKFELRGKRRLHQRPAPREIAACHGWVDAEVRALAPRQIVCLGASAAQSFLGATFRLTRSRGQVFATPWAPWWLATWHPAAILRMEPAAAARARAELVTDLRAAATALRHGTPATANVAATAPTLE